MIGRLQNWHKCIQGTVKDLISEKEWVGNVQQALIVTVFKMTDFNSIENINLKETVLMAAYF